MVSNESPLRIYSCFLVAAHEILSSIFDDTSSPCFLSVLVAAILPAPSPNEAANRGYQMVIDIAASVGGFLLMIALIIFGKCIKTSG
jgi:hypothetical protein